MSARDVRLHEEAQEEFENAAEWYEQQREGLGESFVDAIQSTLAALGRGDVTLLLSRTIPAVLMVRRVPVARFPYQLFVAERPFGFWVLAVAHHRRRPGYWLPRVVK